MAQKLIQAVLAFSTFGMGISPAAYAAERSAPHRFSIAPGSGNARYYTVGSGVRLAPGFLHGEIHSVARDMSAQLPGDAPIEILQETFAKGIPLEIDSSLSQKIKQDLMIAKVQSGGGYYVSEEEFPDPANAPKQDYSKGPLLAGDAYNHLVSLVAHVKDADQVIAVELERSGADVVRMPGKAIHIPSGWHLQAAPAKTVDLKLLNARIGDENVDMLTAKQFDRLPDEIRSRILSTDFWQESLGLPHSVDAYNGYINNTSNEYKSLGGEVYQVSEKGKPIGFIVQMLFGSHVEIDYYIYSKDTFDDLFFYTLRFDQDGRRVEPKGLRAKGPTKKKTDVFENPIHFPGRQAGTFETWE